jgi:hypothetical protein
MSVNQLAFLVGLFGIPLLLLWVGHHVRRSGPLRRRMFWGAVVGHCVAGTLAVTAGLIQPEMWSADDTVRGAVGFWAMLALPVAGALLAGLRSPTRR